MWDLEADVIIIREAANNMSIGHIVQAVINIFMCKNFGNYLIHYGFP